MMTQNNDIMKEDMENMLLKQIKNAVRRSADYKVFHEVAWLAPTLKDHKQIGVKEVSIIHKEVLKQAKCALTKETSISSRRPTLAR